MSPLEYKLRCWYYLYWPFRKKDRMIDIWIAWFVKPNLRNSFLDENIDPELVRRADQALVDFAKTGDHDAVFDSILACANAADYTVMGVTR